MTYDWNNSIVRMERNWEEFDFRISHNDSWDQLNEGMEGSGGLEIQAQGSPPGCPLGSAPIQESQDNLHPLRKEDGQG